MIRADLCRRIAETAVLRGRFTLRSGRTSDYYIDKYAFSTRPEILQALGRMLAERLPEGVSHLVGAELGGIPLVVAASLASGLPCLFVRNRKKGYGTGRRLEGELPAGARVVIVEDVATTGGQVLEVAQEITAAGATVAKIIAVIDREEGARERLESGGHRFESLFTARELLDASSAPAGGSR